MEILGVVVFLIVLVLIILFCAVFPCMLSSKISQERGE